jgi:hypothetical protein
LGARNYSVDFRLARVSASCCGVNLAVQRWGAILKGHSQRQLSKSSLKRRLSKMKWPGLAQGGFDFVEPVWRFEDLAGFRAFGGADDSVAFHHVDEVRGAAVADAQTALQERGRSLAEFEDEADRILKEIVVALFALFAFESPFARARIFGRFEEARDIVGASLLLPELCNSGDFFFGDEGRVEAMDPRSSWREIEQVAAAEEGFSAVGVENGARVDLGGEAEGNAGGNVGLDKAGDDVDRGALRSEHQMNADGAGHLGEARDGFFDVGLVDHHEVGELIDDDHDVRQRLLFLLGLVEEGGRGGVKQTVILLDVADAARGEQL